MDCIPGRRRSEEKVEKMKIVKHRVFNNWMYLLADGKGIHTKLRGWRPGHQDREPEFMWIFRNEITKTETPIFFDIGANVGYQTLIGAELLKPLGGHVYAFEPDPVNANLLRMAVKENEYDPCVFVEEVAVSDKGGVSVFYQADATNLSSMARTEHSKRQTTVKTITLSSNTIEAFPSFIKMDVEGHEVEVIRGALGLFSEQLFPCKILMEVHPRMYSDEHSLEDELMKLINLGFNTRYVVSAAVSVPDLFKKKGYKPERVFEVGNYKRGIYNDVSNMDMLKFACHTHEQLVPNTGEVSDKIVRAIMLERR